MILSDEKSDTFPLRLRTRQKFQLTTPIQHSTKVLARTSRQEREIKLIRIEKEEIKWSLLAYDMILYVDINTLSKKNLLT